MIIRNIGVRHGRQAVAAPAVRSFLRPISMLPKSALMPTTTAPVDVDPSNKNAELQDALTAAMSFKRRREEADLLKAELAKIPANYREFEHIQRHTKGVGSNVTGRHVAGEHLRNPPAEASLEMLLAAQAHMGANTSLWNPANSRYIYGVRDGIHIISLESTAAHLRRAARVVEEVAYRGGLVLFVGTREGQKQAVVAAARLAGGYHLFQRWVPGTITNRDMILRKEELRVVDMLDRDPPEEDVPEAELEELRNEQRPVKPDLVVCMNPVENYTLLDECGQEDIPTIGVVDTDADPTWVTYQIPANDDSLRTTELIAAVLGRAGERGQKRRRLAAAEGVCTWEEPSAVVYWKRKKELELEQKREAEAEKTFAEDKESNRREAQERNQEEGQHGALREQLGQSTIEEAAL
ncbi:putative mitochondrial SSU ribosomal protein S2 precursor [Podospora conica]|nr:putative mitochondrial SSU ribosomal protein S2 precursor [Schizothecium conicum]